jgi:hypothetical protein
MSIKKEIKFCQFNMLAPLWVSKNYKLLPCYMKYESKNRLKVSLKYLKALNCDIYCLSEVEELQIKTINQFLGSDYYCYVPNAYGFWSEWLDGKTWISNGTCIISKNGIKIKNSYALDFKDGCRASCAYIENIKLDVISLHLDVGNNGKKEMQNIFDYLSKNKNNQIVSGDFNLTDISLFLRNGYRQGFKNIEDLNTTPAGNGIIDHTIVKGNMLIDSKILSIGTGSDSIGKIINSLCDTVIENGSDHFATISEIKFI